MSSKSVVNVMVVYVLFGSKSMGKCKLNVKHLWRGEFGE